MSTYLLLRDNKQSGPYTLDEIKAKGFKKYDLVWVESKSAAWRYPGELPELKPFAPIVEEQPFDRFFKKPSQEKQSTTTSQNANISEAYMPKAEVIKSAALPQIAIETGNKKVYAVLPSKKTATVDAGETSSYNPAKKEFIKKEEPALFAAGSNFFEEKETEAKPQQSIHQYQEKNFVKKHANPDRRFLQPAAVLGCVLALLSAGIFIGLSINKNPSGSIPKNDATEKQILSVNKPDPQINISTPVSSAIPAQENSVAINKENKDNNTGNVVPQNQPTEQEKSIALINEKKKATRPKENAAADPLKIIPKRDNITDSNSSGPQYTRREATHRTDAINDKDFVKNSIGNLVSVSSNKYNVGTFGGISEVQLTVSNKSVYPLDIVMVEVQYVQANKKVFKTENIYYRNIRPGESIMQEVPKSSRGIKIQYRVALINSKEPGISYSGI